MPRRIRKTQSGRRPETGLFRGEISLEGADRPAGLETTRGRKAAYFAATPAISTKYLGAARRASTVARAGGFAGSIQASHTEFMSSK